MIKQVALRHKEAEFPLVELFSFCCKISNILTFPSDFSLYQSFNGRIISRLLYFTGFHISEPSLPRKGTLLKVPALPPSRTEGKAPAPPAPHRQGGAGGSSVPLCGERLWGWHAGKLLSLLLSLSRRAVGSPELPEGRSCPGLCVDQEKSVLCLGLSCARDTASIDSVLTAGQVLRADSQACHCLYHIFTLILCSSLGIC